MKIRKLFFGTLFLALLFQVGCVLNPYNGYEVDTYHSNVYFTGYHLNASEDLELLAYNKSTGLWEVFGNATSEATPGIPAGSLAGGDNPDLYNWKVTTPISDLGDPADWCRWTAACAEPITGVVYSAQIKVRIVGTTFHLLTNDTDMFAYSSCMSNEINNNGKSFLDACTSCSSPDSPVMTIYTKD
ncbi:MAG: hypothetical protein GY754_17190 [bacterium]|nr:hypothetical protein [bacterium]